MTGRLTLQALAQALEHSQDGIVITDADLTASGPRIVWLNAAYEALSGYSSDELLGQSPRILQGEQTDRRMLDGVRRALEHGEPFHGEAINYRRNGTPYWVEWDIAPVKGEDGEPALFISIQRDITTRKQAEQALERSNERLRELASLLAHDLQEPLGTVRGYLDFFNMLYRPTIDARGQDYLDVMAAQLDRMVEKIRNLAHQAASRAPVHSDVPLDEVLSGVVRDLQATISHHQAEIQWEALPTVRGSEVDLAEVFQNLLSNAIKYSDPDRLPRIEIRACPARPGFVAVEVKDNGRGIPAAEQDLIFAPYQRGTGAEAPGSGLGLAFVRAALERNGGGISVRSQSGVGSTFVLVLPESTDTPQAS